LAAEHADVLFAWNITLEGLSSAVAAQASEAGVPWVAVPLLHLGRPWFYTMRHQMDLLKSATAVVTQTQMEAHAIVQRGVRAERVHICGPGVGLEKARGSAARFRRAHGITGPIVLTFGPVSYDKGVPHVAEAMAQLWDTGVNASLVLAGPGTAEGTFQPRSHLWRRAACPRGSDQVSSPSGTGTVHRLGILTEEAKWDAIDAADVVVMPSRTESFGLVYLEAWACGKPVIGARAGAVIDVISDGVDGLLVDFGDVPGLALAIRTMLAEPELARQMGARGYEKVQANWGWDQRYAAWRALTTELV
jgi:glycosyltransferase involved in cell wall biosynthesis